MTRKEAFGIFAEAMATGAEVTGKVLEAKGIVEQFGFDSDKLGHAISTAVFGPKLEAVQVEEILQDVQIVLDEMTAPESSEPSEKEVVETKKSKKGSK